MSTNQIAACDMVDTFNRKFVINGPPIDDQAADFLGISGVRINDIIERITPKRKIKGIVAYRPETEAWIEYEDEK